MIFSYLLNMQSHPSWVCGLKLIMKGGLKQSECHTLRGCVDWNAPPTTAISTSEGHTLRGCVDWNMHTEIDYKTKLSHTLRGCVDWNDILSPAEQSIMGHTLRGCVDWNTTAEGIYAALGVTPFVGVWIETLNYESTQLNFESHPSWVCGLKQVLAGSC